MSEFKVEVVPVELKTHPDADALSIVEVYGYSVVVRTDQWEGKSLGAYVPPDSVVDTTRPGFEWLGSHTRIRAQKLRGVVSYGLLIPAPDGARLGDDVAEALGVVHYQPQVGGHRAGNPLFTGEAVEGPVQISPRFSIEALQRHPMVFKPGEQVIVTEKIHGASARWVWEDYRLHIGSHNQWKRHDGINMWSKVALQNPEIEHYCMTHPGDILYGEIYGSGVQDLHYGLKNGDLSYALFDIIRSGKFMNFYNFRSAVVFNNLKHVPMIENFPFDYDVVSALAEGPSLVAGAEHNREGIVVKSLFERTSLEIGRVHLKRVSDWYYTRKAA